MGIDFKAIREKLNELNTNTGSKISEYLWKPQEGPNVVRIVPLAANPEMPFIEAYFHYLGGKTYLSPKTFDLPDPIEEFGMKLREGGGLSKEDWTETKTFIPKLRTFAPIVVRGKESDGVRFWGFGKTTCQEIMSLIDDEDYGDITDVKEGHDLKLDYIPQQKSPTNFAQTAVRASPKKTPLTTDKELLKTLLTVQPDIFEFYTKNSYDELKVVLDAYLAPSATTEKTTDEDWDGESVVASASEKKKSDVKNVDDQFQSIFNK